MKQCSVAETDRIAELEAERDIYRIIARAWRDLAITGKTAGFGTAMDLADMTDEAEAISEGMVIEDRRAA